MMIVNFDSNAWSAKDIKIGSGTSFHIHMIASSPTANVDDFYFAGEAFSLTDGTFVKSFGNTFGFIMKSKTNSSDESCFNLSTGYFIDTSVIADISFGPASFLN